MSPSLSYSILALGQLRSGSSGCSGDESRFGAPEYVILVPPLLN